MEEWHGQRHVMLPGITGLWQVSGRSDLGFDDMVRLHQQYMGTWSLKTDWYILWRTAGALVGSRGAYCGDDTVFLYRRRLSTPSRTRWLGRHGRATRRSPVELEVVMPIFNEEACIASVIEGWCRELDQLAVDYRLLAINDGSTDGTAGVLAGLSHDSKVKVITKPGSGHGPTILAGYRLAVGEAEWVFQCDSDDEMKPDAFATVWALRQTNDAVFGSRRNREQGIGRKVLSAASRVVVRVAYASGVDDVNTPYRLMRAAVLAPIIAAVPESTFAPNLVVSGVLALSGVRIANVPVPHSSRRTGAVSIVKWRLVKAAASALGQTLCLAPKMRRVARSLATTRANEHSDAVVE